MIKGHLNIAKCESDFKITHTCIKKVGLSYKKEIMHFPIIIMIATIIIIIITTTIIIIIITTTIIIIVGIIIIITIITSMTPIL